MRSLFLPAPTPSAHGSTASNTSPITRCWSALPCWRPSWCSPTNRACAAASFAAISSQDLIRLMNQGALVLDIRKPDEFALGHVNGAKHLPSDQILTAGDSFKRFKDKPVVVYCDSGSLAAAAVRQLNAAGIHQGIHAARRLRRLARGEPAGRQGGLMSAPAIVMYTTNWCPYCERARRLLEAKGASIRGNRRRVGAREARRDAGAQRPAHRAADFHRRTPRGRQRRSRRARRRRQARRPARQMSRPIRTTFNTGKSHGKPDRTRGE